MARNYRGDGEPVLLLEAWQPRRTRQEIRRRSEPDVRRMCCQIADCFQVPSLAVAPVTVTVSVSEAGDGVRSEGRRAIAGRAPTPRHRAWLRSSLVRSTATGYRCIPAQVHRMIFERRYIGLSAANSQPPPDIKPVHLQCLCVISATIWDSGKSADPTTMDFRLRIWAPADRSYRRPQSGIRRKHGVAGTIAIRMRRSFLTLLTLRQKLSGRLPDVHAVPASGVVGLFRPDRTKMST